MNNVTIRRAIKEDYKDVKKLMQSVQNLHHSKRSDIHKDSEIFKEDEYQKNMESITVAEINNNVIGAIMYFIKEKLENNYTHYRKVLFIDALVVDPKFRNYGIGKTLIKEIERIARENNCTSVELNVWAFNENAIKFYEKIGMKPKTMILEKSI